MEHSAPPQSPSENSQAFRPNTGVRTFFYQWFVRPIRLLRSAHQAATPVSTRPTREGIQVMFMAAFVLLGAVIRDVNLLILLAGALLALMLIQWRVCGKTLYGLKSLRRLPRVMSARKAFDIELSITNPKRWLGAWLVLAQERIVYINEIESKRNVSQSIRLLFSSIPHGATRKQKYRCAVQRRGKYQFFGTELTTRFPLGLMRGILPSRSVETFVVQPAIGRLLPLWSEIFDLRTANARQRKARTVSDEGDFFGLRNYRPGDSPRSIHWRSSARRDELVVKQFQNEDSKELIVLIDLYRPNVRVPEKLEQFAKIEDLAIEFVATLVHHIASSNFGVITLGIADANPVIANRIQTRSQCNGVLERLAIATYGQQGEFYEALRMIEREHHRVEHLVIVSTRPTIDVSQLKRGEDSFRFWRTLSWIDAGAGDLKKFFVPAD